MTDKNKTVENRRKLLKSVAAGGGAIIAGKTLPEKWTRPAVDSVMLPAHAQTSGRGPYSGTLVAALATDNMFAQAIDAMVPQAHAQQNSEFNIKWCVTPHQTEPTATVKVLVVNDAPQGGPCWADLYSGTDVPVDVRTNLTASNGCADIAANEWLDKMGLVKDAMASIPAAFITLRGLNPGDSFTIEIVDRSVNETSSLVEGACNIAPVDCGNCKGG